MEEEEEMSLSVRGRERKANLRGGATVPVPPREAHVALAWQNTAVLLPPLLALIARRAARQDGFTYQRTRYSRYNGWRD